MAEEKAEEDVLIQEIDDELKQENLQKLWNDYGVYLLAAAVALVVGVAGFKGWQSYDLKQRAAAAERFVAAQELASADKKDAATEAFSKIAGDAGTGYAMLARFQVAALAAKKGKPADAVMSYTAIADNSGIEQIYRDLAVVLGALSELEAKSGANALVKRAENIAKGTGPWRYNAREVIAMSLMQGGDRKTARERYAALAKDAAAPQGLRTRAEEMETILKGK